MKPGLGSVNSFFDHVIKKSFVLMITDTYKSHFALNLFQSHISEVIFMNLGWHPILGTFLDRIY